MMERTKFPTPLACIAYSLIIGFAAIFIARYDAPMVSNVPQVCMTRGC